MGVARPRGRETRCKRPISSIGRPGTRHALTADVLASLARISAGTRGRKVVASGASPAQLDNGDQSLRAGLAAGRTRGLDVWRCQPGDLGCPAHRWRDRRPPRARALRGPSGCPGRRVTAGRCAGPEPLGPQAHQRLANLAGGAGTGAAGRPARPQIGLEVAVLPGTDDFTLNRAVGNIEDTALPGTDGNSGIAGHRDGFFRGLKDVGPGDAIELETLQGEEVYRVERVWVVYPDDVTVLEATPTPSLTLVTCYPFYHVGPAPQRYIVRAVRAGGPATAARSQP